MLSILNGDKDPESPDRLPAKQILDVHKDSVEVGSGLAIQSKPRLASKGLHSDATLGGKRQQRLGQLPQSKRS